VKDKENYLAVSVSRNIVWEGRYPDLRVNCKDALTLFRKLPAC